MSNMSFTSATNSSSTTSNKLSHIQFPDSASHIPEETSMPTKGPDAEPTGDVDPVEPSPTVAVYGPAAATPDREAGGGEPEPTYYQPFRTPEATVTNTHDEPTGSVFATEPDRGWGGGTTSTQVSTNLPTVSAAVEDARCPPSSNTEGPRTSHQCGFILPRETINSTNTAASQEPSASRRTTTGTGPPQLVISKPVPSPEDGYRESVTNIPGTPYPTLDVTVRDFAPTSDSPPHTRVVPASYMNTLPGSPAPYPVTSGDTTVQDVPSSTVEDAPVQTPDLGNIDRVARGPESIDQVFGSPVSSSGETFATVSPGITRASPLSEPSSTLHHTETSTSESESSATPPIKHFHEGTPPKGWTPSPGIGKPDIKKQPLDNQPLASVGPDGTVPYELMTNTAEKPSGCHIRPSSTPNSSPASSGVTSSCDPLPIKAATAATTSGVADNGPLVPSRAKTSTKISVAAAATWETSPAVIASMPTPVIDPVTQSDFTDTSVEIVDSLPTTWDGPTGNATGGSNSSTSPAAAVIAPTSAVDAHTPLASSWYVEPAPKATTVISASDVTVTGVPKLTITYTGNLTSSATPVVSDATTVMTVTYIDTYDKYESATATPPSSVESVTEQSASQTDVSGSETNTFTIYRSVNASPSQTVGDGTTSAPPHGSVTAPSTTVADGTTIFPSLLPGHSTSTSCIRSSVSATAIGFDNKTFSSSSSTVFGTPEIPTLKSPYTWHDPSASATLTLSTSTDTTNNNPYIFPTVGPIAVLSRMDTVANVDTAEPAALGSTLGAYERAYGGVGSTNAHRSDKSGLGTQMVRLGAQTALWGVLLSSFLSKSGKRYAKEALSALIAIALVVLQLTTANAAHFAADDDDDDDVAYAHPAIKDSPAEGAVLGGLGGFAFAFALIVIAIAGTYYIKRGVARTQLEAGVGNSDSDGDDGREWKTYGGGREKGRERRKE